MVKKQVKVKPHAKMAQVIEADDGTLLVHLKSPPVDGKANAELVKLLAQHYGLRKSQVTLCSGLTSRIKQVEIDQDGC